MYWNAILDFKRKVRAPWVKCSDWVTQQKMLARKNPAHAELVEEMGMILCMIPWGWAKPEGLSDSEPIHNLWCFLGPHWLTGSQQNDMLELLRHKANNDPVFAQNIRVQGVVLAPKILEAHAARGETYKNDRNFRWLRAVADDLIWDRAALITTAHLGEITKDPHWIGLVFDLSEPVGKIRYSNYFGQPVPASLLATCRWWIRQHTEAHLELEQLPIGTQQDGSPPGGKFVDARLPAFNKIEQWALERPVVSPSRHTPSVDVFGSVDLKDRYGTDFKTDFHGEGRAAQATHDEYAWGPEDDAPLWNYDLPSLSPSGLGPVAPADQTRNLEAIVILDAAVDSDCAGIDFGVDWAPTVGAERGTASNAVMDYDNESVANDFPKLVDVSDNKSDAESVASGMPEMEDVDNSDEEQAFDTDDDVASSPLPQPLLQPVVIQPCGAAKPTGYFKAETEAEKAKHVDLVEFNETVANTTMAEVSSPHRQFKEDSKKNKKPSGRKQKEKNKKRDSKLTNWLHPLLFPRSSRVSWKAMETICYLVGTWIDPEVKAWGVSKWKASVLNNVERWKGNAPGGHTTRTGILQPYPEIRKLINDQLTSLRDAGVALTLLTIRGIMVAHITDSAPGLLGSTVGSDSTRFRCSESFVCRYLRNTLGWSQRRATKAEQKLPANHEKIIDDAFLREAIVIRNYAVPAELRVNMDQTQLVYQQGSESTWNKRGGKQGATVGQEEKCAFTLVPSISASGVLLPMQAVFGGKRLSRVLPRLQNAMKRPLPLATLWSHP
ncbi:hypothetical protein B0H10DRAFT_2230550 [Mycena sp. CBHHK59/15]|nr:hypothetical protein B0H10DRAFT_2230550 [Mycena sp. CBHHK59/15]